ncbi:ankyrin repeat family protein [Wolffia australiana]
MASIPCSISLNLSSMAAPVNRLAPSSSSSSSSSSSVASSQFLGSRGRLGSLMGCHSLRAKVGISNVRGGGARCWFRFGSRGMDAEGAGIYGSQSRDDFDRDDVEQYFNYMGMLAVEGTYDKMEALLGQNIHPVDILLLMAASEGDKPKIEELMRAGANFDVKDVDGRTALERATSDEIRDLILSLAKASKSSR